MNVNLNLSQTTCHPLFHTHCMDSYDANCFSVTTLFTICVCIFITNNLLLQSTVMLQIVIPNISNVQNPYKDIWIRLTEQWLFCLRDLTVLTKNR